MSIELSTKLRKDREMGVANLTDGHGKDPEVLVVTGSAASPGRMGCGIRPRLQLRADAVLCEA